MRLEWILMAEGFGSSSIGAVTVIGVNQNLFITSNLPAITKRGVLAHFVADAAEAARLTGKEITLSAQVIDPSGEVIMAATVGGAFPPQPLPDLPGGLDINTEFPLRINSYGIYEIRISTRPPEGDEITGSTYLHVREPIEQP